MTRAAVEAHDSDHRNLIINGVIAPPHRYPYFVTLDHYCGGALIAPDFVLTAGHCRPDPHQQVDLRIGTYSFKDLDDVTTTTESMDILASYRHPHWLRLGDDEFVHDFSLIQLNGTAASPIVEINTNDMIPADSQTVVAMGMGDTDAHRDNSRSNILRHVNLTAITNEDCASRSDAERNIYFEHHIKNSHICTFTGELNDKDSCAFDSGSPIIIAGGENSDSDLLIGLVSWGIGCADPVFPGVNARVSSGSKWIIEKVCEHSVSPPSYMNCNQEDDNNVIPDIHGAGGTVDSKSFWATGGACFFFVLLLLLLLRKNFGTSNKSNPNEKMDKGAFGTKMLSNSTECLSEYNDDQRLSPISSSSSSYGSITSF